MPVHCKYLPFFNLNSAELLMILNWSGDYEIAFAIFHEILTRFWFDLWFLSFLIVWNF